MRFLILTFTCLAWFATSTAHADPAETAQLKNIIAVQAASLAKLEKSLKAATDRIKTLEDQQTKHDTSINSLNVSTSSLTGKVDALNNQSSNWSGLDLNALRKIATTGDGVRLRAGPYVFDFRETGTIWFWKDGQPVESLTINGDYNTPQICRAYGRNCVRFYP